MLTETVTSTLLITTSHAYTMPDGSHFVIEQTATFGDLFVATGLFVLVFMLFVQELAKRAET